MKSSLLICSMLLIAGHTFSQHCPTNIISLAKSYKTSQTVNESADYLWFCYNVTCTVNGGDNDIWIESKCTLTIEGDNNFVYIRGPGNLIVNGDGNAIWHENNVTVTKNGSGNSYSACDSVTYDYSGAPAFPAGCDILAGTAIIMDKPLFRMFPNPASDRLYFKFSGNPNAARYDVFGMDGQLVRRNSAVQSPGSIDVTSFENGLYLFRFYINENILDQRIAVHR